MSDGSTGTSRTTETFDDLARRRVAELEPDTDLDAMLVVFNTIRLANRITADVESEVHRPRGLTWAGFRLLFTLWISGPLEPRDLARLSAVTRASISSVLNTLERDGLVERRRESTDRRVVTVVLTTTGRRAVSGAFREHNARESAWLAPLSRAERNTLGDLLHRVLAEHRGDLTGPVQTHKISNDLARGGPAVSARTGKEYVEGLRDAREVWLGGERVDDVTTHPARARVLCARWPTSTTCSTSAPDVCLAPDPETGEPINVSHVIPRSREDLERRHAALRQTAEHTVGLMGRTPDYLNVTVAGFAGRTDVWGALGQRGGRSEPRRVPS